MDPFRRASFWLALRGALALVFGLLCNLWPGPALGSLVFGFAFYAIFDGAALIGAALERGRMREPWALVAVEGVLGLLVGGYIFLSPAQAINVCWNGIAAWAVVSGVVALVGSFLAPGPVSGALAATSGAVSLLLGIAMLAWPTATARSLGVLVGGYAIVFGAMLVALAVQLRRVTSDTPRWA